MTEAILPRLGVSSVDPVLWRDQGDGVITPGLAFQDQSYPTATSEPIEVLGFNSIGIDVCLPLSYDDETSFTVSVQTSLTGLYWVDVPDSAYSIPLSTILLQEPGDILHIDLHTTTKFLRLVITASSGPPYASFTLQAFVAMTEA